MQLAKSWINKAQSLISSIIQKLENWHSRIDEIKHTEVIIFTDKELEGLIEELGTIKDIVRDKNFGDGSEERLNYLTCDVVEMAEHLEEINDSFSLGIEINPIRSWIRELTMHVLELEWRGEAEPEARGSENDGDVVGLEEEVEALLRRAVFNERKGFSTSAVTGIVGIGKTALARQVYNHADVIDRFERRVWVCVSTYLTRKELLMELTRQVVDGEDRIEDSLLKEMDNGSLQYMLHQHLQGMRYFIVLDDLPKDMHLKSFLNALPREGMFKY